MNTLKPKVARARRNALRAYFGALSLLIACVGFGAPIFFTTVATFLMIFFGGISGLLYGLCGKERQQRALQFTEEVYYGE